MLTEEGYISTENIVIAPALTEYRKKLKIASLISLIVGIAGVIAYVVLSVVLMDASGDSPRWVDIFLIFAVPCAFGLVLYISFVRLQSREKAEGAKASCLFCADCFVYSCKSPQKLTETVEKTAYADAVLKRETEKYGYIVSKKGLFVFSKEGLKEEELNAIRKSFSKPFDGETPELKNYKPNEENK